MAKKKPAAAAFDAPPMAQPRSYPKSANFALPKVEPEEDEEERPQSARAAIRSWSESGGAREATFKKRPPSDGKLEQQRRAVGFASVLQAAEAPMDDADGAGTVALWLEQLILKVEEEDALARGGSNSNSKASSPLSGVRRRIVGAMVGDVELNDDEALTDRSVDLDALSREATGAQDSESWVSSHELPRAHPSVLTMVLRPGAVLGVAAEADELARAMTYDEAAPVEEASVDAKPARGGGGGGYGKLGGAGRGGGENSRAKLASWSESGGIREGAFKKSRSINLDDEE